MVDYSIHYDGIKVGSDGRISIDGQDAFREAAAERDVYGIYDDVVMSSPPTAALGRGELVPRRVVRLYRGTTEEWIKLSWNEGGEAKELIATPGHHFEAGCTDWGDSDATPRPRATLRESANIGPIFKHCAQLGAK